MIYHWNLEKWDNLELDVEYEFGKQWTEKVKVVAIYQKGERQIALLDNGREILFFANLEN